MRRRSSRRSRKRKREKKVAPAFHHHVTWPTLRLLSSFPLAGARREDRGHYEGWVGDEVMEEKGGSSNGVQLPGVLREYSMRRCPWPPAGSFLF